MPAESRNDATRPARRTSHDLARELQSMKIRELRDALIATGYLHLDAQARALGLPRSTTWSILQGNHKRIGISAAVIKRMLDQPKLPSSVRAKILEYVDEKSAGTYGHKGAQLRRFAAAQRASLEQGFRSSTSTGGCTGQQRVTKMFR